MAAFIDTFPPFLFVNVEDVAQLHVAALLLPDVEGERILAFAGPFNRNDLVRSIRKLFPGRQLSEDIPGLTMNESSIMPAARANDLLKGMWDKEFTSLDDSLKDNLEEFL
ncbi:hypothetical protein N7532_007244 [Penicillium argentinense]|uniref:Uncharacterized protein n=1 Tax=Penicillium argentinense TaxID=1131581 RepID=A0A9W9F7B7_9EURO|nr:uncharacterized protein N7532_007244 [Penicillium argentinense]KAJ5094953.1 hypothetical protein N7532_007244 [Penicillium argentinense]